MKIPLTILIPVLSFSAGLAGTALAAGQSVTCPEPVACREPACLQQVPGPAPTGCSDLLDRQGDRLHQRAHRAWREGFHTRTHHIEARARRCDRLAAYCDRVGHRLERRSGWCCRQSPSGG
jgi:hypothetical protein